MTRTCIFYTDVCCHLLQATVLDCQPGKKKVMK